MINLPSGAAPSINPLMRNTWRQRGPRVGWAEFRKPHPLLVYTGICGIFQTAQHSEAEVTDRTSPTTAGRCRSAKITKASCEERPQSGVFQAFCATARSLRQAAVLSSASVPTRPVEFADHVMGRVRQFRTKGRVYMSRAKALT